MKIYFYEEYEKNVLAKLVSLHLQELYQVLPL